MSAENHRDKEKMMLFTQGRDTEIDRLIEETESAIINTRKFIEGLAAGERECRDYIEDVTEKLEWDLEELKTERRSLEDS